TTGLTLVSRNGINYSTLANLIAATGVDADSVSTTVTFTDIISDLYDLHLAGFSATDGRLISPPLVEVTIDLDGDTRTTAYSRTAMGADEADDLMPLDDSDKTAGFYTAGGAKPDFPHAAEAIEQLNLRGMKGEATIRIRAGTYDVNKTLDFTRFAGTTELLTIRASNTANPPTLRHAALSDSDNWIISFNGADFVRLRHLDFVADGGDQWGNILTYENSADDNIVKDCTLTGITGFSHDTASLILDEPIAGDSGDRNTFINSTFTDGSSALRFDDNSASDTIIDNNIFVGQKSIAITINHANFILRNNTITHTSSTLSVSGIHSTSAPNFKITGNKISVTGTSDT
ncbi:MAG: hypothetical protein KAG66_24695, partial [Methylococcales bacterium]|nr:hypothetical protein [Methylococcales bacterium]